jgi:ABC-type multidrug transport system ATPase subunit
MNLLTVENLTKSFGEKLLFENISFGIEVGQKVALIARNGAGKSTLIRILAGEEIADEGKITMGNDITISYLPQNPEMDEDQSVLDYLFDSDNALVTLIKQYEELIAQKTVNQQLLGQVINRIDELHAWDFEAKIKEILGKFDINDLNQKIGALSGGMRKKVALSKALIEEANFIILDEPTNHLDITMIEWLENYLDRQNLSLFIVTHDRYFLDKVCNVIIELDGGNIYRYKGNYAYFLEKKAERLAVEMAGLEKARSLYNTELEWMRRQPQARATKPKAREDYITVNELVSLFPPGWDVTLTSTQHVIAVPLDANPRILETPIEPGDFIGVFFTNTFGNLQCGGATMWDGQNNIAIISYGDQSFTPLKDGFSVYEDFKWKVYSYGHQREFDATPVYDVTLPNLGQFFPLGISALIDLSAGLLFNIHIPAGWSGISSPILPFYPEMDTVLSSIQDNLTILYNFDGIYWPWQNINTLDKWKNSGYTIKMSNADNLVIGGELIKSLSQTIKSGTGYLPIPTLYDVSTASLFAPFLDKLTLVRNILGTEVFWPQTGINTLPILKPGNAYITHAKSSFIVHFPQSGLKNSYSSPNSDFPELPLVSWSFAVASPDVHMISIPADGFKNLETGDIVGVFTPNNVCAGWAVFENQPLAIPVYGTHEIGDEKSGFMANEPFTFRIFRPFNQLYCTAKALFDTTMPDQGIFRSGGISAISSLYPFDESFTNFSEEITVIPNPNNGIFVLSGVSNTEEIVVISQEGQIIKTIENNGTSELNVDISENRRGIYLIKIIEKQRVYVKKVVIN